MFIIHKFLIDFFKFVFLYLSVLAIDCYVCSSLKEDNKLCEDPFIKDLETTTYIVRSCYFGYFKATHCVKLKGTRADGSSILVRQCGDYDWGSHCGKIIYMIGEKEEPVNGCLETCDYDGCNTSTRHRPFNILLAANIAFLMLLRMVYS
ncbi:hypothetical protein KUTeg_003760 [Tegillarca granosa]|uniref:Protein sleepless n=1 Tax=Tegillarca granosa TaxID=220873 RepID=A0ABQ9FN12_TEGGR|nr:hypothetical protein KUTeg_003760 [Tegillarca granosa]